MYDTHTCIVTAPNITGTMADLCFQNLTFSRLPADFDDLDLMILK